MKKVYIVFGQTGEYSDHRDWVVAAYLNKAAAEKRVADCTAGIPGSIPRYGFDREIHKNPHDDQFQYDYTGTEYFLSETDLVDGTLETMTQDELEALAVKLDAELERRPS